MPVKMKNVNTSNNGRDGTNISDDSDVDIDGLESEGNRRDGLHMGKPKLLTLKNLTIGVVSSLLAALIIFVGSNYISIGIQDEVQQETAE